MAFVDDRDIEVRDVNEAMRRPDEQQQYEFLLTQRRASVQMEPVNVPACDRERLVTWRESMTNPKVRLQLTRLLRKTLIFSETSEEFRASVVEGVWPVEFSAGQVVYKHREVGDWLGIIICGRLDRTLHRLTGDIHLGEVGPGGIIGDLGLFGITPTRSFTVKSLTQSVILVLTRQRYQEALAKSHCAYGLSLFHDASQMHDLMADTQSFLNLRCFQGLNRDFVMSLRENSEPRVAYTNQVLMRENHFGDEMYILRAGTVKIWKNDKFVVELPAGVVLGELAVLGSDKRRTATVTCNSLCLIRALHSDVFYEILNRFPDAKRVFDHAYVARVVSVELHNAKDEVHNFNTFYGAAQPKSSGEMRDLFGNTIKIEEKRPEPQKVNPLALPPLTPRRKSPLVTAGVGAIGAGGVGAGGTAALTAPTAK